MNDLNKTIGIFCIKIFETENLIKLNQTRSQKRSSVDSLRQEITRG